MKKGFTLAEIMIVLMVIGILTAILLPSARNAMPNENVIKFKKAHNSFFTAIRELVNSDEYYLNGDLGIKPNGDYVNSTYLCETLKSVLNVKKSDCQETSLGSFLSACTLSGGVCTYRSEDDIKSTFDAACLLAESAIVKHITLNDGTVIYEPSSKYHFGGLKADLMPSSTYTTGADGRLMNSTDENNFYRFYKFICIDIDGIPTGATSSNCINECPFGYGLRIDGKIIGGLRADEWFEKSIQSKD